jgi:hypothetical protein
MVESGTNKENKAENRTKEMGGLDTEFSGQNLPDGDQG